MVVVQARVRGRVGRLRAEEAKEEAKEEAPSEEEADSQWQQRLAASLSGGCGEATLLADGADDAADAGERLAAATRRVKDPFEGASTGASCASFNALCRPGDDVLPLPIVEAVKAGRARWIPNPNPESTRDRDPPGRVRDPNP